MTRILLIALAVFVVGCATDSQSVKQTTAEAQNPDRLLVVDCLLPGQVRKLGTNLTYLTPRRPAKTTAIECEIRGGEYAAYDRANYATALKVWLPKAKEGDAAAQTYVGEIYEKGLGVQADYTTAARWYTKAAQQGYTRAQINLGYLYEGGLGVSRDLTTAMNWYRKASGFDDGQLEFVSSIEVTRREAARRQTAELVVEVGQLRNQLSDTQKELDRRRAKFKTAERQLAALRQEVASKRQAIENQSTTPVEPPDRSELDRLLKDAQNEQQRLITKLARQQLEENRLRQQLEQAQAQLQQRQIQLQASQSDLTATREQLARAKQTNENASNSREVLRLESKLKYLEAVVKDQKTEMTLLELNSQKQRTKLTQELEALKANQPELQQNLENHSRDVAMLQSQLSQSGETVSKLERQLSDVQTEHQRLVAKLSTQQLNANQLRGNLTKANEQLESRRLELESAQEELAAAREELARRRETATTDSNENQRLEARISDLLAMVNTQKQEMAWFEEEMRTQHAKRAQELDTAQRKEGELQLALNTRNQEISALQAQLATAREQITDANQSAAQVEELETELKKREAEIAQQKNAIEKLEADLSQSKVAMTSEKVKQTEFAAVVAPQAVGPAIEIIEPPLSITRGKPSILLRSQIAELELIGRVAPAKELMALRINDLPQKTDTNGLFQVRLAVADQSTPVSVVAVDRSGGRAAIDFVIVPKTVNRQQSKIVAADSPRPRKASPVDFGEYHALIIGNDNYAHLTNLNTARNDARAVDTVLRTKYGFKTKLLLDADRYTMLSALNEFRDKLTENDNLLIYYAGHGELDNVNLRGHWLPVDAEPESSANWISNIAITDVLNVMSAKHVLVVADSCYSGSLTRSSIARLQSGMTDDARAKWYKALAKARARAVLTSGGVKPVLDSGGGDHSIFAQAFLDVLKNNDEILEGYRLYRQVQTRVKQAAATLRVDQDPQYAPIKYAGHEAGEFFFTPTKFARSHRPQDGWIALASAGTVSP